ncbi:MAG: EF-P lysine aminoacylase EpmA [Pseudomonadales bacterium]|nr:EF-P lysine aminoacylase EpmA [Pseudomonadales bacterium]
MSTDWLSVVSHETLVRRATLLRDVRDFFAERNILEVTTPTLGSAGVSDAHIENITVPLPNSTGYLQTSPEYAMKRLLAGGSGAIYQIAPAYRGGESGRRHSIEFTMLEWYRPGLSLLALIAEVQQLLDESTDGMPQCPIVSYRQLFEEHCGVNPHQASVATLFQIIQDHAINADHLSDEQDNAVGYLDLLFSVLVEPKLDAVVVTEFPACQAALAKTGLDTAGDMVAQRFEFFLDGLELANGYDELDEEAEIRSRFASNNKIRQQRGTEVIPIDERAVIAMSKMPPCVGVALGLDRLLMRIVGARDISKVINFSTDR